MGQELAGRLRPVEAQRHVEVVPQQAPPPVPLGAVLGHRQEQAPGHDTDPPHDRHADEGRDRQPDVATVDGAVLERGHDQVVGDPPQHPGPAHRGQHEQQCTDHGDQVRTRVGPQRSGDQPGSPAPHVFLAHGPRVAHGCNATGAPSPRRRGPGPADGRSQLTDDRRWRPRTPST